MEENIVEDLDEEETKSEAKPSSSFQKVVLYCLAIGFLCLIIILAIAYFSGPKEGSQGTGEVSGDVTEEQVPQEEPVPVDADKPWLNSGTTQSQTSSGENTPSQGISGPISPGISDVSGDTVKVNNFPVTEDAFVKDLNSVNINVNYEVDEIYEVIDFISYEKKRAILADGIELYWLEAEYKGKPAKVQVPFKIFKELDPVGITVVNVEVVRVTRNDEIISEVVVGFTVRDDYKSLLEGRRR